MVPNNYYTELLSSFCRNMRLINLQNNEFCAFLILPKMLYCKCPSHINQNVLIVTCRSTDMRRTFYFLFIRICTHLPAIFLKYPETRPSFCWFPVSADTIPLLLFQKFYSDKAKAFHKYQTQHFNQRSIVR